MSSSLQQQGTAARRACTRVRAHAQLLLQEAFTNKAEGQGGRVVSPALLNKQWRWGSPSSAADTCICMELPAVMRHTR